MYNDNYILDISSLLKYIYKCIQKPWVVYIYKEVRYTYETKVNVRVFGSSLEVTDLSALCAWRNTGKWGDVIFKGKYRETASQFFEGNVN